MNDTQPYNIIRNAKIMLLSTTSTRIKTLQDSISADVLNLELSVLHHNKIYDTEKTEFIHEMFNELSNSIDLLIESHKREAFAFINNLMRDFAKSISPDNISKMTKNDDLEKNTIVEIL